MNLSNIAPSCEINRTMGLSNLLYWVQDDGCCNIRVQPWEKGLGRANLVAIEDRRAQRKIEAGDMLRILDPISSHIHARFHASVCRPARVPIMLSNSVFFDRLCVSWYFVSFR